MGIASAAQELFMERPALLHVEFAPSSRGYIAHMENPFWATIDVIEITTLISRRSSVVVCLSSRREVPPCAMCLTSLLLVCPREFLSRKDAAPRSRNSIFSR